MVVGDQIYWCGAPAADDNVISLPDDNDKRLVIAGEAQFGVKCGRLPDGTVLLELQLASVQPEPQPLTELLEIMPWVSGGDGCFEVVDDAGTAGVLRVATQTAYWVCLEVRDPASEVHVLSLVPRIDPGELCPAIYRRQVTQDVSASRAVSLDQSQAWEPLLLEATGAARRRLAGGPAAAERLGAAEAEAVVVAHVRRSQQSASTMLARPWAWKTYGGGWEESEYRAWLAQDVDFVAERLPFDKTPTERSFRAWFANDYLVPALAKRVGPIQTFYLVQRVAMAESEVTVRLRGPDDELVAAMATWWRFWLQRLDASGAGLVPPTGGKDW